MHFLLATNEFASKSPNVRKSLHRGALEDISTDALDAFLAPEIMPRPGES
ncbi:hypothetical protein AB1L42_03220 [Thalassoglobus sp. JC818]